MSKSFYFSGAQMENKFIAKEENLHPYPQSFSEKQIPLFKNK